MTLYQPEPVEISTRMRPGEWTEENLTEIVAAYRNDLMAMGAPASDIRISTERDAHGGVSIVAAWIKAAIVDEQVLPGSGTPQPGTAGEY
ncbi:hypothetical protein [Arthrobacter sp. PAMC25284]|uniref:hypothetical protein n=1 Tax=Arthrobacter sp. PAMC25284 TaxID=2861279 RepID=UPI001C62FF1E|nr:hypothetical protein [Arthrobacter sp. PAMC25284]QYF90357.1 hypothetical protein KY499_03245 [Arthrobacter sp. PAMC25284]